MNLPDRPHRCHSIFYHLIYLCYHAEWDSLGLHQLRQSVFWVALIPALLEVLALVLSAVHMNQERDRFPCRRPSSRLEPDREVVTAE